MAERAFLFSLLFLLITTHPVAAHAYLPVIIGLVGLVGGAGAAIITALLAGLYIAYRFFRGKRDDDEDEDEDDDAPTSH